MQPADWRVQLVERVWAPVHVSTRWPILPPWWADRTRLLPAAGVIHILIAWGAEGDLPSGPAEVAGTLCAQLMESWDASHPIGHHMQGRASTPAGLASTAPPPCDCPPWMWGGRAEEALAVERRRIRAPLERRWVMDGLGGG